MVSQLRRIRSELNLAPGKPIALRVQGGGERERALLAKFDSQIRFLARVEAIEAVGAEVNEGCATGVVGDLRLLVPLAGLVDLSAERTRLDKEIRRIQAEIGKCEGKLASETFVANAPAAVVAQERARLLDWTAQLSALSEQRALIA